MASPFTIFRRNQRMMLAVLGVAAMVAFVFLDPLARYVGRSSERVDSVVVKTKYGNLHESEIYNLRQTRKIVEEFLRRVAAATVSQLVEQKVLDPRQQDMIAESFYGQIAQELMGRSGAPGEEAAVETYVLAKRAEQLGIVISDNVINEWIKRITNDSLRSSQIAQIIAQLGQQGTTVSQGRLFDALRTERLASEFSRMFQVGLGAIPPGQRWDYFERINRRATVELLAVQVANFVAEVPDPKDAELRKFFDQYKDRLPDPASPEPGFKQPKKIAVQYFKADFDKFVQRAEASVTDEQIAEYYEKNKDTQFRESRLPPDSDEKDSKPGTPESKDAAAPGEENKTTPKPDGTPPKEDPTTPKTEDPAKPKTEDADKPPAEGAAKPPADGPKPPAEPTPADPKPAEPKPSTEQPDPAAAKEPKSAAAPVVGRPSIRLVSAPERLLAAAAPAPAESAADAPQPAGQPPAGKPAESPEKPAATSPDAEKPAAEKPAADKPAAETPADKPAAEQPAADKPAAEKPAGEKPPADAPAAEVKYQPLDKVKDDIRKTLARREARQQINKIMDELETLMRHYADDRVLYESQAKSETNLTPPEPLNFGALAKQFGVSAHRTESQGSDLISAEEARDATDIGKSYLRVADQRSRFGERLQHFDEVAFDDALPKYKPVKSEDIDANYLFWKTNSSEEQVPDFDKARPQVLRAWKMIKARKIAHAKAEKYLAEAKSDKATLADTFDKQPEVQVVKPSSFSWLTMGNVPRDVSNERPRMSEVIGVDQPGSEFMRTVFQLSPGEYAVAANHPETVMYVIQLLHFDRTLDALFDQFGQESFSMYRAVSSIDLEKAYFGWIKGLMTEADVHWERDPVADRNRL